MSSSLPYAPDEARQKNEPELFEDLATAYARAAHLSDASLGGQNVIACCLRRGSEAGGFCSC